MVLHRTFFVGAGQLSDHEMRTGSSALATAWGRDLIEYTCSDKPGNILNSLLHENCLIQLLGDAAMFHSEAGSWLEALGAWRQPIILKVIPTPSGEVPGSAAAYTALCESFHIPLIGLIQVGGDWKYMQRRLDGLPWLGFLPTDNQVVLSDSDSRANYVDENVDNLLSLVHKRLYSLGF